MRFTTPVGPLLAYCALAFAVPAESHGKGFDSAYQALAGDVTGDGLTDIVISKKPDIIILHGDISTPITLLPYVKRFALVQEPNASFTVTEVASNVDLTSLTPADIRIRPTELNYDGLTDLVVSGLDSIVSSARMYLVLADSTANRLPLAIEMNDERKQFMSDTFGWALDHNYFADNAPPVVTGGNTASAIWFGGVSDPTNFGLISQFVANCTASGGDCAVSSQPPSVCWRYVAIYDSAGNITGYAWVNVCLAALHVYAYQPGSVTIGPDYSVFSPAAIDFANAILAVSQEGIVGVPNLSLPDLDSLDAALKSIMVIILNRDFFGRDDDERKETKINTDFCETFGEGNQENHAPMPNDDDFPAWSPEFHHYDTRTPVCTVGEAGCGEVTLREQVLRRFTYPNRKLRPEVTPLDRTTPRTVYIAPPWAVDDPDSFKFPIGPIVQGRYLTPPWGGTVENRTLPSHLLFDGLIARDIVDGPGDAYNRRDIFTHGTGISDLITEWPLQGLSVPTPIGVIVGCINDAMGPKAFETLDRVAIEYWQQNYVQSGNLGAQSLKTQPQGLPAGGVIELRQ